jgi:hypothetical protein
MNFGNLNFLGPSGPLQACNGTAVPLPSYAQPLIKNHSHSLGHMEDVMGVVFTTHKGRHLDTVERYQKTEKRMQINDKSTITKNKM